MVESGSVSPSQHPWVDAIQLHKVLCVSTCCSMSLTSYPWIMGAPFFYPYLSFRSGRVPAKILCSAQLGSFPEDPTFNTEGQTAPVLLEFLFWIISILPGLFCPSGLSPKGLCQSVSLAGQGLPKSASFPLFQRGKGLQFSLKSSAQHITK